jgi:hypothetical protein
MTGGRAGPQADDDGGDLADGIVGVTTYEYSERPKKKFQPWHRPRKHFVRHEQWMYFTKELVNERGAGVERLSYFGLPGADLLDIRYFGSEVCEPNNIKLRFLGFDKSADPEDESQSDYNISYDEVSKAPSFDPQSEVIPDDFRDLVDESSVAWQKTFDFGPYDVVNLDLCDGVTKEQSGAEDETYYNAIAKLLAVQARNKSPWLLFLTTRVGVKHVHKDALARLSDLYSSNLKNCQPFRDASRAKFKIENDKTLAAAKANEQGLQSVVLVGICKWLLKLACGQNPPAKIEIKGVMGYRVRPEARVEDMVSIAIRFEPTHNLVEDPGRLAKSKAAGVDECDLATKALTKISKLFDVDGYLSSESPVMEEMLEATCKLLEAARYDPAEYRLWVKLDSLAIDCGLRLVIDETNFELDLMDGPTGKRVHGPFKLLTDVEKKLSALQAAKLKPK